MWDPRGFIPIIKCRSRSSGSNCQSRIEKEREAFIPSVATCHRSHHRNEFELVPFALSCFRDKSQLHFYKETKGIWRN
ncbi:hypothetical protein Nepgr_012381 [Nepenthes gracilis]|uniref:Uncharacterized protein n=1 Tax=Nepenthes gracilis TaxID=150966 RepID=A0AAD3SGU2_NEPGR|nr:hypothetical protein Nepgr_012381 [Nepenthes gracilis]